MNPFNMVFIKNIKRYKKNLMVSIFCMMLGISLVLATLTSSQIIKKNLKQLAEGTYANANILVNFDQKEYSYIKNILDRNKNIQHISYETEHVLYLNAEKIKKVLCYSLPLGENEQRNTEEYSIKDGKLPCSDSECMITFRMSQELNKDIGDSIILNDHKQKKVYKITAIILNNKLSKNNNYYTIIQRMKEFPNQARIYLKDIDQMQQERNFIQSSIGNKGVANLAYNNLQEQTKEVDIFLKILMSSGLGLLVVSMGISLYITKLYFEKMRLKSSILKAIGVKKLNIIFFLMKFPILSSGVSVIGGICINIFLSKYIMNLMESNLRMNGIEGSNISLVNYQIALFIFLYLLLMAIFSFAMAYKEASSGVIEGFQLPSKCKNKKYNFILLSILICIIFISFKVRDYRYALYGIVGLSFPLIIYLFYFLVGKIMKFKSASVLVIWNSFQYNLKRYICLIFLISTMGIVFLNGELIIKSFEISLKKMEQASYQGDIIVKPIYGSIGDDIVQKIKNNDSDVEIVPEYRSEILLKNVMTEVLGYEITDRSMAILKEITGMKDLDINLIKEQNTAFVSRLLLQLNQWKVGDHFKLGKRDVTIVGTYESPINNGKSVILNSQVYKDSFENGQMKQLNIFYKNKNFNESKVSMLKKLLVSKNFEIQQSNEMRIYSIKHDGSFLDILSIFNIFILLVFMMVVIGLMYENRKINDEQDRVLISIGLSKKRFIYKNIADGFFLYLISCVITIVTYRIFSKFFIDKIDKIIYWGLKNELNNHIKIEYFLLVLLIIIGYSLIASVRHYSRDLKYYE